MNKIYYHCFGILLLICGMFLCGVCTAYAETVCFQCHKKEAFQKAVVHKPVTQGQCSACHNPHVARYKGLLQKKGSDLCYSCHQDKGKAFEKGFVHLPVKQGKCLSCHDAHSSNGKGLLRASMSDLCLDCHKELKSNYAYAHSTYAKGECLVCHQPHQSENPLLLKTASNKLCQSCHNKGGANYTHKSFSMEAVNCLSCHTPHGSDQKALIRNVQHQPFQKGDCAGCHAKGKMSDEICLNCHEKIKKDVLTIGNHVMKQGANSCIACHSPHAGDQKSLLKGSSKVICRSCHVDTFSRYETKRHVHPKISDCNDCHAVHGANNLAMLKKDGVDTCSVCHEAQGKFTHPVGENVRDALTNQMVTCVSCHNPMGTDFKYNVTMDYKKDLCIQCHRTK